MFRYGNRRASSTGPHLRPIGIRTLLALSIGGLVLAATAAVLTIALFASARNTFELLGERTVLILDGIESEVRDKLQGASRRGRGRRPGAGDGAASQRFAAGDPRRVERDRRDGPGGRGAPRTGTAISSAAWRRASRTEPSCRQARSRKTMPAFARCWRTRRRARAYGANPSPRTAAPSSTSPPRSNSAASGVRYVVAAVSLGQFSRFVDEVGRSYGATAFILYGEDHLLAHPRLVTTIRSPPATPSSRSRTCTTRSSSILARESM